VGVAQRGHVTDAPSPGRDDPSVAVATFGRRAGAGALGSGPSGSGPAGIGAIAAIGREGVGTGAGAAPMIGGAVASGGGHATPASELPQPRQNFMPLGFSLRQVGQIAGNPDAAAGVCVTSALPQFRQNAAPLGLSWPQTEHRITPSYPSVSKTPSIRNGMARVCNTGSALLRPAPPVHRLLLVCLLAAACTGETALRTAPFRARPDAAEPGSLRGPFTGRVVDATTHAPIAGALVVATWSLERGTGLLEPAGAREVATSTDAAGNYKISAIAPPPAATRIAAFALIVYKRGYVAYRSDRRFIDLGPRMDFAQRDNQVLLERWRNDLSHARHLRFVGSNLQVSALTQWELADASSELEGKRPAGEDLRPGRGEGPYVVAAQLLTETDIKARTKYDGNFETGPLSDEPDTATYSSQHFKAIGRPETWDVAIRVWRLDPGKAQERYDELLSQLPGISEKDEIASRSFMANEADIRGIGFLDGPRGVVVLITCGTNQCGTNEDANALAQIVYGRVKQLLPTIKGPAATGDKP
jgi:hypothetical protein